MAVQMPSSLEIAQEAELRPIAEIAEEAGLDPDEYDLYGTYQAKVDLSVVERLREVSDGKLVCVTAITPTKAGEGKTTTSVSLTQGLGHIGKRVALCLREASLGPVFGIKGGAAGGGYAQVVPMEDLNLHFTGDIHAIGAANNLLAAMLEAHLLHGNELGIDPLSISWRRCVDINDRALRDIAIGLGGRANGYEGQPAFVHCGPFANIAHGNNSLVADRVALKLGDYVVTESGFGSDMGMEKFFDIVCRFGGLSPSAAVLVTTVRAIKHHGGVEDDPRTDRARGRAAIEAGMANVRRHLANVTQFGVPCVVAVNRRPGDTNEEGELLKGLALEAGAFRAEANEGFAKGGIGAADLASAVVDACEEPSEFRMLYDDDWTTQEKIEAVARRVYGAADVYFYPEAEKKIGQYSAEGLDHFPVCMAKTHLSLSADPQLLNAPENFSLPVRDIRAYTGAGWLVPLCGDIMQMPGLGKAPAAVNIDIDDEGRTVGLF